METVKKFIDKLPHAPGVYIYKNVAGTIIYIGKALDLYRRVRSYFTRDDALGVKTKILVSQIHSIETIQTASEFDALLLEARLIHTHQPKYNSLAKDDKSPLYICLTFHERLPRVLSVRKPPNIPMRTYAQDAYFGPFQSGRTVRFVLSLLRRSIPYCTQKKRNGSPCFYTHIHLCSPCPSVIEKMPEGTEKNELVTLYRKNIYRLKKILSGKAPRVLDELQKEMQIFAKAQNFEQAAIIRNQILSLESLLVRKLDPSVYIHNQDYLDQSTEAEQKALQNALASDFPGLPALDRIECFDISNLSGTNATGSMVVLTRGQIDTSQYRRFKIRSGSTPNDVAMMSEVLTRRLKHTQWPFPDLILVDGGKTQVRAGLSVLHDLHLRIPLVGLAKRREEIVIPNGKNFHVLRLPLTHLGLHCIERIRDEAHRFAITYHRKLRATTFDHP